MKTQSHTPGPWNAVGMDVYHGDIKISLAPYGASPDKKTNDKRIANARLIAAAPEMLEALKSMHYFMLSHKDYELTNLCNKTTLAISKAEGKGE